MNTGNIVVVFAVLFNIVVFSEQKCSNGWEGPSPLGKCYHIMDQKASPWTDADGLCKDAGAVLASIETAQEDAFISANIVPLATDWLVTGGRRQPLGTSGNWTWSDGSAFTYTNWASPAGRYGGDAINDYMCLSSHPLTKGTANYGKWYADHAVTHQVLCQMKDPCTRSNSCNRCGC